MNACRIQKPRRNNRPHLEELDSRIAPAAVGTAALAAEIRVESRQVGRWQAALGNAEPGSRKQAFLDNHIARTEGRIAVQEARLARIEASQVARMEASALGRSGSVATPQGPIVQPSTVPGNPVPIIVDPPVASSVTTPTLSASPVSQSTGPTTTTTTTTAPQSSLPANVSQTLSAIYSAFEQDPSAFPSNVPTTNGANLVVIEGTNVGIQVKDNNSADLSTLENELQFAGMQITDTSALYGTVVGLLPIAQLPTIAAFTDVSSVAPQYQPSLK